MTDKPDEKQPTISDTLRADSKLLAVAAVYCVGDLVGMLSAAHGVFGPGFTAGVLLVCAGPVLWLGILGIAFEKHFSLAALVIASIAIWGMTAWSFWVLSEGIATV
jgi:hypothetical protein